MSEHVVTDYAATMASFRLEVPARFNWAFDTFDGWARDPARLALLWLSLLLRADQVFQ